MDVSVEPYGQYQGHNLYELTLTNDQGMVVKLLNYGATLEKCCYQKLTACTT